MEYKAKMNKIKVRGSKQFELKVNSNIVVNDYSKAKDIKEEWLFIYIPSKVTESLTIDLSETKANVKICLKLDSNSELDLFMISNEKIAGNIEFKFIIKDYSTLKVNKFYYVGKLHEQLTIMLAGYQSKVYYNFSTITNAKQKYFLNVYHQQPETVSIINNRGITKGDTALELEINSYIPTGMKDSIIKQTSKIITLGENYSVIKPNLFVTENDVLVSHGASIGRFLDSELFYLQTRGIVEEECYYLLMQAFIFSILTISKEQKQQIKNIIKEGGELSGSKK